MVMRTWRHVNDRPRPEDAGVQLEDVFNAVELHAPQLAK
jgi:hypothetical protein